MDHLKLTADKLSVDEISNLVVDDSCGAISLFVGTTRDNFEGKKVLRLEYEAYEPMAIKAMKAICDDIRNKWSDVHNIAIYHRLGSVPTREASVVIAVSSPHRADSLAAVAHCIDKLKASVPIWKKEVYDSADSVWKENAECKEQPKPRIDKNLVQINVSNEELQRRIQNFIERKRQQVDMSNIHDFIPSCESETDERCARVNTQFVKRSDSKGHLKVRKVNNEWGPQTVRHFPTAHAGDSSLPTAHAGDSSLPDAIAERVQHIEKFCNVGGPVSKDIYKRIKVMEDKIAELQGISPEYAEFWKIGRNDDSDKDNSDYAFSADDINKKIEQLERMNSTT